MKIAVIGTGYVGLVTGTCLAETGNQVVCVDIDQEKVQRLNGGEVVIYEPGLDILLHRNVKENRLFFTTNLSEAFVHADFIFLALPTPPGEDGAADLSYILQVATELGRLLKEHPSYKVIINKSTVPVGTAEKVRQAISETYDGEFDVVSNPEFLREGAAVEDFMKPDRVVIGCSGERARKMMQQLYAPFVRQGNPVLMMDERSAELTKYASNAYLAMRITFMNELANLCERAGADVETVRVGMGSDSRIGKRFLFPGIGYGGSCFPKDVQALVQTSNQFGYPYETLQAVIRVNDRQKKVLADKIIQFFTEGLTGKRIAIWGLAFKPNTDDIREAPAFYIMEMLASAGAELWAYDPEATENARHYVTKNYPELSSRIHFGEDAYDVLDQADALAICTEWSLFRTPSWDKVRTRMKAVRIFDGRNLFEPQEIRELGFYYNAIGREIINP